MDRRFDVETYRKVQSDGLLDMVLGGLLVVFFLGEVAEVVGGAMIAVPLALLALLVGGLIVGRRTMTYPRVGVPGDPGSLALRRILAGVSIVLGMFIGLTALSMTSANSFLPWMSIDGPRPDAEIPEHLISDGIVDGKSGRLNKAKLHQKLRDLAQARQYARAIR